MYPLYNLSVNKTSEIINKNSSYNNKIQNNLIIEIIGGIVAIAIAFLLFGENSYFKNKIVKYGLLIGAGLLLFHGLFCNWNALEDSTKLFIFVGLLLFMIMYTYKLLSK